MAEIILPANNWTPRPHQRRAWAEIQGGKKGCAVLAAPLRERRFQPAHDSM